MIGMVIVNFIQLLGYRGSGETREKRKERGERMRKGDVTRGGMKRGKKRKERDIYLVRTRIKDDS